MMHSIYYDWNGPEEVRRQRLYEGQLFVYSPRPSMMKLINHARSMIEKAFQRHRAAQGAVPHAGREIRRDLRAAEAQLHPSP
jgi:hypothetical protein